MMTTEYVGLVFVLEPDGDEAEVRASLRIEPDGWWGWLPHRVSRLANSSRDLEHVGARGPMMETS